MSLSLGVSDNQLVVKLTTAQTAVIRHCTGPRILPLVNKLLAFNQQHTHFMEKPKRIIIMTITLTLNFRQQVEALLSASELVDTAKGKVDETFSNALVY